MRNALAAAVVALVLVPAASAVMSPPGFMMAMRLRFDAHAKLVESGVRLDVHGPLDSCTEPLKATIRATVTQHAAGAWGEGRWRGTCSTKPHRWRATVRVRSQNKFQRGTARACGLALAFKSGQVVDAIQWCSSVKLVGG